MQKSGLLRLRQYAERRETHLAIAQVHTLTTTEHDKHAIDEQSFEMTSKLEVLDQRDVERKHMGSVWRVVSIDKRAIAICEAQPLRGHSYIETPKHTPTQHAD